MNEALKAIRERIKATRGARRSPSGSHDWPKEVREWIKAHPLTEQEEEYCRTHPIERTRHVKEDLEGQGDAHR